LMRARNSTTSGDRLLTMRPALFLAVVDGSRSVAQNLGSHPYQGSARGLVSTGSQLRPAQRCTAGDRCEPLGSDGVWTKRGPGMPACGGSGAPRRGPRLARETPAGCPRQASPAWAIALLGGALAGSGPGTSPCIDGLSLVTGMVVPSTLRVQTTRTMVGAWTTWNHEADQSWCPEAGARPLGRWDSNPHGLPHRDLNCAGRVVAGGIPGAVSPLSRSDAQAPSRPVPPRPGASQRVP
jgi:hypothetical protein